MRDEFKNSENWSKHFLPHYNAENKYQMITYRLADSLPQKVLSSLGSPQSSAGKNNPGSPQSSAGKEEELARRKTIESALDKGYGSCILARPDIAEKVIETWEFYHKKHYQLISYVVMPNHVHVLIKTLDSWDLGKIVWAWKSYVSKYVLSHDSYKAILIKSNAKREDFKGKSRIPQERQKYMKPAKDCGAPRKIALWHREYWDRFIRDENHFQKAIEYIHMNPVKAGLVDSAKNWEWSSCFEKDA